MFPMYMCKVKMNYYNLTIHWCYLIQAKRLQAAAQDMVCPLITPLWSDLMYI